MVFLNTVIPFSPLNICTVLEIGGIFTVVNLLRENPLIYFREEKEFLF